MYTFLPYPNIYPSVAALTNKQLHKQKIDAKKILDTIEGRSQAYRHHPAVKMWSGHNILLKAYLRASIHEWLGRGFSSNMEMPEFSNSEMRLPLWWGGYIHMTHRSFLLRANPKHYKKFKWRTESDIQMFWPVKHNGDLK